MAPTKSRKRKNCETLAPETAPKSKKLSKSQIEKSICSKKLNALEEEESKNCDNRFSSSERKTLLDAYNTYGFRVLQDIQLLLSLFPHRKESDLKGLIDRLKIQCGASSSVPQKVEDTDGEEPEEEVRNYIDGWRTLCNQLLGNFAKDRKINLEDTIPDALSLIADELQAKHTPEEGKPDYSNLMRSFAQLVSGKFPDDMTPASAKVSIKLYQHITGMIDRMDLSSIAAQFDKGEWLKEDECDRKKQQKMALEGLEKLDGKVKKCPTVRDLERNKNIEALCLELPKLKRITDMLNPLCISKSHNDCLMKSIFQESRML